MILLQVLELREYSVKGYIEDESESVVSLPVVFWQLVHFNGSYNGEHLGY